MRHFEAENEFKNRIYSFFVANSFFFKLQSKIILGLILSCEEKNTENSMEAAHCEDQN